MTTFSVAVTNIRASEGVGPAHIEAESEDEAKAVFAAAEGTTVEKLAAAGLTHWTVAEIPQEPTA